MEATIGSILGKYEQGKISRRQFIESVSVIAAASVYAPAELASDPPAPIVPVSVNHIAIGVSDLQRSKDWYTRILKLKGHSGERSLRPPAVRQHSVGSA